MKKVFYLLPIGLLLIIAFEVGLYFYLTNKNQKKAEKALISPSPALEKQIEIVSKLDNIDILGKQELLMEILERWKIWEEGVYVRDFDRALEIKKNPPGKIKIIFDYNNHERDKAFSKGELISSATEERVGNELTISLGFSKKLLDSFNNQEKEMYLTQSFMSTLYRISHTEQNFERKEEELKRVLIEYTGANKNLFAIK